VEASTVTQGVPVPTALPSTGASPIGTLLAAAAALVLGGGLVITVRRRAAP